jgi:DNA end-binding protein Ku
LPRFSPRKDVLVLNTLRYADELKKLSSLEIPEAKVTAKELDMALRLVEDMADEWKPEQYRDTYREDLLKRVEEKVKAGQTEEVPEPEKARAAKGGEVIDLMSLLKKSISDKKEKAKPQRKSAARRRRAA